MDKVRLGRALGYGARHAAKTLQAMAEAASAPDPGAGSAANGRVAEVGRPAQASPRQRLPDTATVRGVGRSVWRPLATFSGALWLRVTGMFFGLVACAMGMGVWRLRGALLAGKDRAAVLHFWMFAGFGVLFGYFAVSGFVRAHARERRGR